jgi:hypothetical protein
MLLRCFSRALAGTRRAGRQRGSGFYLPGHRLRPQSNKPSTARQTAGETARASHPTLVRWSGMQAALRQPAESTKSHPHPKPETPAHPSDAAGYSAQAVRPSSLSLSLRSLISRSEIVEDLVHAAILAVENVLHVRLRYRCAPMVCQNTLDSFCGCVGNRIEQPNNQIRRRHDLSKCGRRARQGDTCPVLGKVVFVVQLVLVRVTERHRVAKQFAHETPRV